MTALIGEREQLQPAPTALGVTSNFLGLPFDERYQISSHAFPEWLLAEPISFPVDHLTFGWACRVPNCTGGLSEVSTAMLCVRHEREFASMPSSVALDEFTQQAVPIASSNFFGWGVSRADPCGICGPGREVSARGYCGPHAESLRRELRRGGAEEPWRQRQEPLPPNPICAVPRCVHDGVAYGLTGNEKTRICKVHRGSWVRHQKASAEPAGPGLWSVWVELAERDRAFLSFEQRGLVSLQGLPHRLQCEVRYGIHRHSTSPRRSQWRPRFIQDVVDMLAEARIQTLSDPAVGELTESATNAQIRRILNDLPVAARSLTVTKQDAKEAGWFDPVLVGSKMFKTSQTEVRSKPYDLNEITQPWLRDLLWDHLEYLALQPQGKRPSEAWVSGRILGIRLLSRAFRQLLPDEGNDPRTIDGWDATAFKELWDLWCREQIPLIERRSLKTIAPITDLGRYTHTNAMRIVLTWGRKQNILGSWIDAFLLSFPTYDSGRRRGSALPRPILESEFRQLLSAESLQIFDQADTAGLGFTDIWTTHALQGGRITETLRLRLGCVGLIGDSQPYLWRDISKIGVVDYGMPCYQPIYERLRRRQELTRSKLRDRYASDLAELSPAERQKVEREWDRKMPLFPGPQANFDLKTSVSQAFFRNSFNAWIDKLGLAGITSHRTRATLATALLNNGAPPELVRQLLGHMSLEAMATYGRYNDDTMVRHLRTVWAAGPGMEEPGSILLTPNSSAAVGSPIALGERIDLTTIPVEHGLCRYGPVVGGSMCPANKNCTNGEGGPCEYFILTGADLAYWERKRDAAYHFAEGAPSEEARDYILSEWKPWELVIAGLRAALDELGLLDEAERLDLRSPLHDYYSPVFSTAWPVKALNNDAAIDDIEEAKGTQINE